MGKRSREKREKLASQSFDGNQVEKESGPKTFIEKICLAVITAGTYFILLTPLVVISDFFFPYVSSKSLYFMGFVQIIFFTWLFLIIYFPQYRPRKNPLSFALILFLIVLILSSLFGESFSNSFWSKPERMTGLLMIFHLLAFFLVVSSVFQKSDWFKVFSVSTFVGVILSLIAFFSKTESMQSGATLGNSSFLGTCLLFNIFLSLWLFFNSEDVRWKVYFAIAPLVMLYAVFFIGARAATYSTLGGLALLFLLYLAFGIQKSFLNILGKVGLAAVLAVFLISVFLLFQPDNFIHNWFVEQATYSRLVVWEKAWEGFLERPVLGWGPENFDFVFIKNFNPCMFLSLCGGQIWFDRAHNIIFDTLITAGLLGMLAYITIFFSTFYVLWKNYLKKTIKFWTAGIFSVLLLAYFIQNLTVFDMVSSYMILFLVLGFVVSFTTPRKEPAPQRFVSPEPWVFSALLISFILFCFFFVIQPIRTSRYTVAAIKQPIGSEQRLDLYKEALGASPLGKYQVREFFGQQILMLIQSERARQIPPENFKREIDFLVVELEKTAEELPLDFRSQITLGKLYSFYALLSNPPDSIKILEAERVLQKAIEVSPTNQQGYWALAQVRLYQGRIEEAISLTEQALALEPNHLQSHLILIQVIGLMEDGELKKNKIQEAAEAAFPLAEQAVALDLNNLQSHLVLIQIAGLMGDDELKESKIRQAIEINPEWEASLRGGN